MVTMNDLIETLQLDYNYTYEQAKKYIEEMKQWKEKYMQNTITEQKW